MPLPKMFFENHGAVFSQTAHTVFSANSPSKAQGKTTLKLDISTGASTWETEETLVKRKNMSSFSPFQESYVHRPQKSNMDTPQNCLCLKGPVTFSKAHHFGYPGYFFRGVQHTHTHNL